MKPLYIFDLDGTLALIQHRRHLVKSENTDWRAFFAGCVDDIPNLPVIRTLHALRLSGADIWIWSGRSDEVRPETCTWLFNHLKVLLPLKMRVAGDHQPDVQLKKQWLSEMDVADQKRLVAVFDDRARVVDMWRNANVACFQVADGDF